MSLRSLCLVFLFSFFSGPAIAQQQYRWTSLEVIGPEPLPEKAEIEKLLPFKLGDLASDDSFFKLYDELESTLNRKWPGGRFQVSALRFMGGEQYLIVDRYYPEFLPVAKTFPENNELRVPERLLELNQALQSRGEILFDQGTPAGEDSSEGFKNYADPEMASVVEQLNREVPPQREYLLKVLAESSNAGQRALAAELLNWSREHRENLEVCIEATNDPADLVRNNVTRYLLAFTSSFDEAEARKKLIEALAWQMRMPDHTDRNKALYAILHLLEEYPEDAEFVQQQAGITIRRLAKQSILSNVGETAKLILEKLPGTPFVSSTRVGIGSGQARLTPRQAE
jgi:hypothetical protein